MNMPRFAAEASLDRESTSYRIASAVGRLANAIRPQFCDLECLTDCYFDCQDLPPRLRVGCLQRCRRVCCQ
jgi:hypothetical protein